MKVLAEVHARLLNQDEHASYQTILGLFDHYLEELEADLVGKFGSLPDELKNLFRRPDR